MKAINKWALVVSLLVGLASCEMKDEIFGKDPMSGDTGVLSLSVETGKKTKGSTDQIDQFPVTITGTDVEYTQKFDTYAELKEAGSVTLPVGTYTIEACSPGDFKSEMDEPFYGGEQEVKIQLLKDFTKMDFSNPMGWTGYYDTELKELKEAIETVLNMLKEKDEEIERIRYIKNSFDYVVQKETEKKDKQIDLMVKYINYLSDELVQATGKNELEFCNGNKCCKDSDYSCEQCIKQYFKELAERKNKE